MAANRETAEQAGRAEVMGSIMDSSQYLADHMHEVPVMVIPCLLGRPEGLGQGEVAGLYGSILPAAWSLMLALRSRGLGSAWTTLHLTFEQEAAAVLGIPDTVTQVALIPVAYYTGDDFKPARRQAPRGLRRRTGSRGRGRPPGPRPWSAWRSRSGTCRRRCRARTGARPDARPGRGRSGRCAAPTRAPGRWPPGGGSGSWPRRRP